MDIRVQFIAGLYFDLFQAVVLQQRMELADDQFNALSPGGCFTIFGPVAVREFQIIQDGKEGFQDITFEAVLCVFLIPFDTLFIVAEVSTFSLPSFKIILFFFLCFFQSAVQCVVIGFGKRDKFLLFFCGNSCLTKFEKAYPGRKRYGGG